MTSIVLLHGWGMRPDVFNGLRSALHSRYAVTAPACAPRTLEGIVADLAAAAPTPCNVVGWSLGATVALAWAKAAPRQVERLALIGATPCFVQREDWHSAMKLSLFEDFAARLAFDGPGALKRFTALQAQGDARGMHVVRTLLASLAADSPALRASLMVLGETDLRNALAEIVQPALVVHGLHDALIPLGAAEYLAGSLGNATLRSIERTGHAPFISDPERVARTLNDFFA